MQVSTRSFFVALRNEKFYVVDNAFLSNRQNTFSSENIGWRLENVVYVELHHRAGLRYADVFYYRDRTFEVDFIVAKSGVVEELYQVCYDMSADKTRKREINSLIQGAKKFHCNNLTIITFAEQEEVKQDDLMIKIVPAVEWLLM